MAGGADRATDGAAHPPPSSLRGRLGLLLKICVSAGILYWIFTFVSVQEIYDALRASRAGFFVASLGVALASVGAAAARMRLLTACQGMSVTAPRIFAINLIATFYGMFLPGSLAGGAIRWRKLYLVDRNALGAFVAMVLNRFLLTTMMVAVGAAFWALGGREQSDPRIGLVFFGLLAGLLLLQGVFVFGIAARSRHTGPASDGVAGGDVRVGPGGGDFRARIRKVAGALGTYRELSRGAFLGAVGLALAEEMLGVIAFVLMAMATGLSVPLLDLGWVRSFILLIGMVPISFFGIGVQEGALIVLLDAHGVTGAAAVAFSFLLVARTVLISLLGGLFEARDVYLPESERRRGA